MNARFRWLPAPGGRIAATLLVLTGIFYWKILFTRQAIFPWDLMDFHYPLLAFIHEELRHFRFPLWLPYAFSGFPVIADPEAQIFYPLNWLMTLSYCLAPLPLRLVEIQVIAHYFLAGLFMFYLARDFTRDTRSALFAAILYQFSGAMVAHASHLAIIDANAWYPLVFMLARRGLLERRLHWTLWAGFFFGIENLTGHFQHSAFLGLLLFLYFAYEACAGPLRSRLWPNWMVQLALIAAIGGGLAMVQILPTSELNPLSIRTKVTAWEVAQGNDPAYLCTVFLPNYLGGLNGVPYLRKLEPSFNYIFLTAPGCLFALLGLIQMARRRNFFWLGLIVVCSLISIGNAGHLAPLLYYVPVLNLFRHAPMYFDLANFGLCLMAAIGMRTVWDEAEHAAYRELLPKALISLVCLIIILGWAFRLHSIPSWNGMVLAIALFAALVAGMKHGPLPPPLAQYGVIALVTADLFFHGMNQTFNQSLEDPRTAEAHSYVSGRRETLDFLRSDAGRDFRVAAFAEAQWSNGWSASRIPGIYGWNPIMLRRYQEYIRQFTHSSDYAQPHGGPDHLLGSPMLDLLGVKYLVTVGSFDKELRLGESSKYEKVFQDQDWWKVYRNKHYLPRAWFYPTASVLPEPGPLLALMNSRWFSARESLLFAKSDMAGAEIHSARGLHTIDLRLDRATAPVGEVCLLGGKRELGKVRFHRTGNQGSLPAFSGTRGSVCGPCGGRRSDTGWPPTGRWSRSFAPNLVVELLDNAIDGVGGVRNRAWPRPSHADAGAGSGSRPILALAGAAAGNTTDASPRVFLSELRGHTKPDGVPSQSQRGRLHSAQRDRLPWLAGNNRWHAREDPSGRRPVSGSLGLGRGTPHRVALLAEAPPARRRNLSGDFACGGGRSLRHAPVEASAP
jgi:hypothetical protein